MQKLYKPIAVWALANLATKQELAEGGGTDRSVTDPQYHYSPAADPNAELTASPDGAAGGYALNTEYEVLTGLKVQRDARGHITGVTYTSQKVKDTNTTYSAGTAALLEAGSNTSNRVWSAKILADFINSLAGGSVTDFANGGTMEGDLHIGSSASNFKKIYWGDSIYCWIGEETDDYLTIYSRHGGHLKSADGTFDINGAAIATQNDILRPVNIDGLTTSSTFSKNDVLGINGVLYRCTAATTSNFPITLVTQDGKFLVNEVNGKKCFIVSDYTLNSGWEVWTDASVEYWVEQVKADLDNFYRKSQTYSRDQIDQMISAIPKFSVEVVNTLPTTNISPTTVYLRTMSGADTQTNNLYTEYIYVNGSWEILGVQTINLANYFTADEITAKFNALGAAAQKGVVTAVDSSANLPTSAAVKNYVDAKTPAALGFGIGTCGTAAATAAKVVTLSNYVLTTGGYVSVRFTYNVPASATLNINSKGAKAIRYKNAAIAANVIQAGDTATFVYDGSYYHLVAIDTAIDILNGLRTKTVITL